MFLNKKIEKCNVIIILIIIVMPRDFLAEYNQRCESYVYRSRPKPYVTGYTGATTHHIQRDPKEYTIGFDNMSQCNNGPNPGSNIQYQLAYR